MVDPGIPADSINDGLVLLEAVIGPSFVSSNPAIDATLYTLLKAEADIFAFIPEEQSTNKTILHILIEFCDVEAPATIMDRFKDFPLEVNRLRSPLDY